MKHLALTLILICSSAVAGEMKISRMKNEQGMDRSFLLATNSPQQVTLDCQSFVQGLYLGPRSEGRLLMLEAWECEELYLRIKASLKSRQKHCIDAEDSIRADYTCLN